MGKAGRRIFFSYQQIASFRQGLQTPCQTDAKPVLTGLARA
tara:strand:+ start:2519 stop:2641 length:123 start_codon:yes stop_codon:yes gene_type:complete